MISETSSDTMNIPAALATKNIKKKEDEKRMEKFLVKLYACIFKNEMVIKWWPCSTM